MGAGHDAAARALADAARRRWPGCELAWVDTLEVMGAGVGPTFRTFYVSNVRYTPSLYEFYFNANWRYDWFARSSKAFVGAWCGPRLERRIRAFEPDLIISTYPLGSAGLAWLRRHGRLDVPVQVWVCDFAPHPFWVYEELDIHFVMHEIAIASARAVAPTTSVRVAAPPVEPRFTPGDRAKARAELGLPSDEFVAFISCGSLGFGAVEDATRTMLDAGDHVTVMVVAGRNERLRARLESLDPGDGRLWVLGWVDDVPTLLRASDVVVTNAGGATALEALATQTPVVMFQPIAAHGRANAEYMMRAGLADLCTSPEELTALTRRLRADPDELERRRWASALHCAGRSLTDDIAAFPQLAGTSVPTAVRRACPPAEAGT